MTGGDGTPPLPREVATSVTAKMEARDADERPFNGGRRLRRDDGLHTDGVVNEFEEI